MAHPADRFQLMQRVRYTAYSSFSSSRIVPTSQTMTSTLGKMPTTSVRRLTSPCRPPDGLAECSFARYFLGSSSR
jgi:hypothetical protein